MMPKTSYAFLLLLVGSWLLELVLGTWVVVLYWGMPWYLDGTTGHASMAENIASLGQSTPTSTAEATPTATGVIIFVVVVFIALHLLYVVRFVLLGPFLKCHRLGARKPSRREQEQFNQGYLAITRTVVDVSPICPPRFLIVDGPGLQMRYIGYTLVIDRELLWHSHFPPLLAVELGYANSKDCLARLLYDMLPITPVVAGIMAGFPLAIGHLLLFPFWMCYWRKRVYRADAFAVKLGQGQALIRALDDIYTKLDQTTHGVCWLKPVPSIKQRIDRIWQNLAEQSA